MFDDVGAEIVVRRTRRNLSPNLDWEEIEEANRDACGWTESYYADGIGGVEVGMEVDMIAAIDELHAGKEPHSDTDVASIAREFGAPVTFNGFPVDRGSDHRVLHEIGDLDKPFPHDDMDVARTPRDPDTRKHLWAVLDAREDRDHHNDSRRRKINPHKGPGRERGRELIRTMRERGDIAA